MGRSKGSYNRYSLTIDELMTWKYHLPRSYIERGMSCVRQTESWSCGPNSAVRALHMLGKRSNSYSYYSDFVDNCPKSFGHPQTTTGKFWHTFFGFLTFGMSAAITEIIPPVGPRPGELANYIDERLGSDGSCWRSGRTCFSTALDEIKTNLNSNDPVIALLAWAWNSMHYVNVVGVSDDNDVAILDTNNTLYYYTENDFEDQMDVRSYDFISDNYVLIRFGS